MRGKLVGDRLGAVFLVGVELGIGVVPGTERWDCARNKVVDLFLAQQEGKDEVEPGSKGRD